ncbi:hypothetical protein B0J11DRAFT_519647 [Dendryphion nanum]|uniref:Uncharacterized protein n=1 Tax=Dendryphion nanum TaxID=256645 RepID=A0A9P9IWA0_9PLEO|nr:hypothetical protein B0J11DRAFT_519647 [Dendryphion nanum]
MSIKLTDGEFFNRRSGTINPKAQLEMNQVLRRFNTSLSAIIAPPMGPKQAFNAVRRILCRLPALQSFYVIVPYDVMMYDYGIQDMLDLLSGSYRGMSLLMEASKSNPDVHAVILKRHFSMETSRWANVDDDEGMGRAGFRDHCQRANISVKLGFYKVRGEQISYYVEGGEPRYDDIAFMDDDEASVDRRRYLADTTKVMVRCLLAAVVLLRSLGV